MKKGNLGIVLYLLFFGCSLSISAQNLWTQKADFPGFAREGGISLCIDTNGDGLNDRAFIGAGWDQIGTVYKDFWEYNAATDSWSQKADIGTQARAGVPVNFSLHGMGYVGAGADSNFDGIKDFWQYNPQANTWTQKNDLPGAAGRWGAFSIAFNNRALFGLGNLGSYSSPVIGTDLWEYNDTTDTWTTLAAFPGTPVYATEGFSLDINGDGVQDKVYIGPGITGSNGTANNKFWEYDRATNTWTQKSNVPGANRQTATAFKVHGKGYLGLGANVPGFANDMYEYNQATDQWLPIATFPGSSRAGSCAITIGDTAYVIGGVDGVAKKDVYAYVPFLNGFNTIHGKIYVDANSNCTADTTEQNLAGWIVSAIPGPYFASADSNGNYSLRVASGSYTVNQISAAQQNLSRVVCPVAGNYQLNFSGYGADTTGFDFGDSVSLCPYLTVNVASTGRRRCFENLTVAHYCNEGFNTAYNAQVAVKLPQYVSVVATSDSFVFTIDSTMLFSIDSISPGQCGDIYIIDYVSCADTAYLGLTVCTEAWITPANTCMIPDSNWNRADLVATAVCTGADTVILTMYNQGTGDMTDSTAFRVYFDSVLVYIGKVKLDAGAGCYLEVPSGGQTIRIEVDEPTYHPFTTSAYAWAEGCGITIPIAISRGFVDAFPTTAGGGQPDKAINCMVIDGSWDPNDKAVLPAGLTASHFVKPGIPLHYEIRFQNTGTAPAVNIVVIDTLSPYLDPATLKMTGSSHKYQLEVSGEARPILKFTFANINLPDSGVNQLQSQGFITYSARPYANAPLGTVINNFADIYFDFNPAVRTNTAFSTLSNFVPTNLTAHLDGTKLVYSAIQETLVPEFGISLFPNPNDGQFTIGMSKGIAGQVEFSLTDLTGKILWYKKTSDVGTGNITVNPGSITKGIYLLNIISNNNSVTKKIVVD